MWENSIYQKGLLYLLHSVALADGVSHEYEEKALAQIKDHENIPDELHSEFIRALGRNSDARFTKKGLTSYCNASLRKGEEPWLGYTG